MKQEVSVDTSPESNQRPEQSIEPAPLTSIIISNKIVDFGNVSQDTVLKAEYKLINSGVNPLVIYYVNPDCICTAYHVSNNVIGVNSSAIITLEFNTKGKSGFQQIYATLCVNTEDRMYKLTLKANIQD